MNRIRDLRTAAGWTQAELGRELGCVGQTVSKLESEVRQLDPAMINALCDLFGCSADYLLGRTESLRLEVSSEDQQLLHAYHSLPLVIRQAVDGLLAPYLAGFEDKKVV